MSIAIGASPIQPEPQLAGQTVVVIGGSAAGRIRFGKKHAAMLRPICFFRSNSAHYIERSHQ